MLNLQFLMPANGALDWPSAGNEVHQDHDDRNDQQDVNKRAYRVAGDHAEQP